MTLFASQSQSRVTNSKIVITYTKKGAMPNITYIIEMKSLGDELVGVGHLEFDPEMVDYILIGLDCDYDPIHAAVSAIKEFRQ